MDQIMTTIIAELVEGIKEQFQWLEEKHTEVNKICSTY